MVISVTTGTWRWNGLMSGKDASARFTPAGRASTMIAAVAAALARRRCSSRPPNRSSTGRASSQGLARLSGWTVIAGAAGAGTGDAGAWRSTLTSRGTGAVTTADSAASGLVSRCARLRCASASRRFCASICACRLSTWASSWLSTSTRPRSAVTVVCRAVCSGGGIAASASRGAAATWVVGLGVAGCSPSGSSRSAPTRRRLRSPPMKASGLSA